jgi:hypothetical protein
MTGLVSCLRRFRLITAVASGGALFVAGVLFVVDVAVVGGFVAAGGVGSGGQGPRWPGAAHR